MKKKVMQYLAVFLAALLVSACGGGNADNTASPVNENNQTADTQTPDSESSATEAHESEAPVAVSDGRTPLTLLMPAAVFITDYDTNEQTLYLEDAMNVDLTIQTVPSEGAEEKVNIILASGDLPDIFVSLMSDRNDMMTKYGVDEGLIIAVDDLIQTHAPNTLKAISKYGNNILDTCRMIDGKLYSMIGFDRCHHCNHYQKMWVYQPFLDALGLEVPTTTDEFYEVLKAFKDQDPNGNGIADEVPLSACANGWGNDLDVFLISSFTYFDRWYEGFYVENGVIKNTLEMDEYKEGLKYMNMLYKEGLIYENAMTQDMASLIRQGENPEAPILGFSTGGAIGVFVGNDSERMFDYRPVGPLKGPSGYQTSPTYPSYPHNGRWVISADCEYPEVAVALGDKMLEPEVTLMTNAGGKEGNFWRWGEPGEVGFDGQPAKWFALKPWQNQEPQNESWIQFGLIDFADLRASQAYDPTINMWGLEGVEYMLYTVTMDMYVPYARNFLLPPLNFLAEDQEQVSLLRAELKPYMEATQFDFIFGGKDIESNWESYVNELQTMIEPLRVLYQAAYDRQYK